MNQANKTLRDTLKRESALLAPGVYDALSAAIAEQCGFDALYLSGGAVSYTQLGRPDVGLTTMSEAVNVLGRIRDRVELPIIVDGDTGFGNALNTQRSVRDFERAGANMIQLEDQTFPKRCGHLENKSLVSTGEMVGKLKAALDARRSPDTLIMARTDAIAVEGLEAAFERAEAYLATGVDALFIEALRTPEQMSLATQRFSDRVPMLANMVEGGKTPILPVDELTQLGFKIVIFPGGTVRLVAKQLQRYFKSLKSLGTTAEMQSDMLDFIGLNEVVDAPALLARSRKYAEQAALTT
ncbi:isocitrate lyase/PEP mutase family protein [Paraburkholderia tropica]|uniref:isocitrate lyase/PEP mutase family protein n=1 Tax=Paraburkholderia tropica TaxID=92647 RepID=UPI002AB61895|nr:isocitrate lyase/phosphoenolpyruvate mutase family protein [Paraburkholderia tropica]